MRVLAAALGEPQTQFRSVLIAGTNGKGSTAATLAGRVAGVPVAEWRYSSLRAVSGGLVWLKEPLTGVLGEGAADLDASRPRPALERFDLAKRTCTELVPALNWFDVSGDGLRLVVRDEDALRVVPSDRAADAESPDTVTVDLSRARFTVDPVAQWRHAYDEAGRYVSHDFWVADMADVDWAGMTCSSRFSGNSVLRTRTCGPRNRRARAGPGGPGCSAPTSLPARMAAGG